MRKQLRLLLPLWAMLALSIPIAAQAGPSTVSETAGRERQIKYVTNYVTFLGFPYLCLSV